MKYRNLIRLNKRTGLLNFCMVWWNHIQHDYWHHMQPYHFVNGRLPSDYILFSIYKLILYVSIFSVWLCIFLLCRRVAQWVCLFIVQIPFKLSTMCSFAGISLMINNAAPPKLAGLNNGLAMMCTAVGRSVIRNIPKFE